MQKFFWFLSATDVAAAAGAAVAFVFVFAIDCCSMCVKQLFLVRVLLFAVSVFAMLTCVTRHLYFQSLPHFRFLHAYKHTRNLIINVQCVCGRFECFPCFSSISLSICWSNVKSGKKRLNETRIWLSKLNDWSDRLVAMGIGICFFFLKFRLNFQNNTELSTNSSCFFFVSVVAAFYL